MVPLSTEIPMNTISDRAKSVIDTIFEHHRESSMKVTPEQVAKAIVKSMELAMEQIPHPEGPGVIAELKSGSCNWYIAGLMGAY